MSDIKKWMKLIESSENRIADHPVNHMRLEKNATVTVNPRAGAGIGRFVAYEDNDASAMIDIKGIIRKLSIEDFSVPSRDYEDPYIKGNDWFHVSQEPNTIGSLNDKPEFRPGDMVKIADVYGAVIGPGFGIFIAYGTTGQDCIVSFDNKEMLVPVANIASVLEQNAKDNFGEMDNDGNLSPMSLGSENVKVEEPTMDRKDEFSKWISAVEEALGTEGNNPEQSAMPPEHECGCCKWDCPACFPDQDVHPGENAMPDTGHSEIIVIAANPGMQDDEYSDMEEVPMHGELDEISKNTLSSYIPKAARSASDLASRAGYELGSQHAVETDEYNPNAGEEHDRKAVRRHKGIDGAVRRMGTDEAQYADHGSPDWTHDEDGHESPLSYGEDNLGEDESLPGQYSQYGEDDNAYSDRMEFAERDEMIQQIMNLQDMGISQSSTPFTQQQLETLPTEQVKKIHSEVTGNPDVTEDNTEITDQQDEEMLTPPMNPQLGKIQQQGQPTMENVDKDIQTWLGRFKAYDELRASKSPVMEKKEKPDFLDVDKDGDKKESFKKAEKDKEKDDKKKPWDKESKDTDKEKDSEKIKESADADVLEWMARFSKLGNMKGYGR